MCISVKVNVIRLAASEVDIALATHSANNLTVSDAWAEAHFNCAHLAEKRGMKTLFVKFGNHPAVELISILLFTNILLALNVTFKNLP